ncbi:MAG: hypothetical protein COX48_03315 [bacterium (Candidatus Stahlbacteria) CG23_combo_of_CG06-09_8_20_14_all_34_7]|nr:MAG: hypothetical protein COX48_03315 [bacterium (Candidatus Stahlbacteria) CG23_combo_of_CG06-09_8_20_14_all_34_7]
MNGNIHIINITYKIIIVKREKSCKSVRTDIPWAKDENVNPLISISCYYYIYRKIVFEEYFLFEETTLFYHFISEEYRMY